MVQDQPEDEGRQVRAMERRWGGVRDQMIWACETVMDLPLRDRLEEKEA